MRRWRESDPVAKLYRIIKDRAARKRQAFSITLREFRTLCVLAGYLNTPEPVHLDRIDHCEGYHLWNVRFMSARGNCIKGGFESHSKLYDRGEPVEAEEIDGNRPF